jgi:hypothetical protein
MAEHRVHDREDASVGELVSRVTTDLSTLMRQELELAKAELKEEAVQAGKAAGLFGAGGVAGLMTLGFLSLALMFGLAVVMPLWLAALIVGLLWAAVGGATVLMGRTEVQRIGAPERTIKTVKEDMEWVKTRGR